MPSVPPVTSAVLIRSAFILNFPVMRIAVDFDPQTAICLLCFDASSKELPDAASMHQAREARVRRQVESEIHHVRHAPQSPHPCKQKQVANLSIVWQESGKERCMQFPGSLCS